MRDYGRGRKGTREEQLIMAENRFPLLSPRRTGKLRRTDRASQLAAIGLTFSLVSVVYLCTFLVIVTTAPYARSAMWGAVEEISTDVGIEDQGSAEIAVNGDEVHVVWIDRVDGDEDIYYRHFNGTAWQPEQEVSGGPFGPWQRAPSIAVNGSEVHVVWYDTRDGDQDVYYRHFNGTAWQPEQEISIDYVMEDQFHPDIAVNGSQVHVVWTNRSGNADVDYRRFNGTAWEPILEISYDPFPAHQGGSSVAVCGDRLHVVWTDWKTGLQDIYYRHFNGTAWEPEQKISTDIAAEQQRSPHVAAYGDQVHVTWVDLKDGDDDIYYRHFNGTAWEPEIEISMDAMGGFQTEPEIAVNGDEVHIVWTVYSGSPSEGDIYYRHFNGTAWEPLEEISVDIATESQGAPGVAVSADHVHVVWNDLGDGDSDVFYRRTVLGPGLASSVNPISPYWQWSSTFDVGWTATDDKGLTNISLYFRHSSDNASWLPWEEWGYNNSILGTSAVGFFSFSPSYGEGFYEFYTIANDTDGNGEKPPPSADAICGHDITPPSSSMKSIVPYWTMMSPLPIDATAIDLYSGVATVELWFRYSSDNASWIAWESFAVDDTTPWSWDFNFPYVVGFYEFCSIAVDNVGNPEFKTLTAETTVGFADRVTQPSNVSVVLSGSSLEDVTIFWDLSPDDGGGNYMVVGYYVFRGTTYDPIGGWSYPNRTFLPPGTTSYVDVQAGEGDPNSYFYSICASDPLDFIACAYDQVSKFTRQLTQGVNLVSVPLALQDHSIESVLQTVDLDKAWTYDSFSGEWKSYTSFKPYSGDLITLNRTMGVWVDVSNDCNLTVAGIVARNTVIQLYARWNLVGYPSFNATYTTSDLKTAVNSQRVEEYNTSVPYHLKVLGDTEFIQAGYGYWVWVDSSAAWIVTDS
jgi:hypothetical protein